MPRAEGRPQCRQRGARLANVLYSYSTQTTSSLFLQNIFQRLLFLLIHRQQLLAKMRIGRIHSGLRTKIVDGAIQHEKLLAVARLEWRGGILELRFRVHSQLVDRLLISDLRSLHVGESRTLQKRLVAAGYGPGAMPIKPDGGNCQDHDHGSSGCGLPSKREAKPEREPAASFCALFSCSGFFGERAL